MLADRRCDQRIQFLAQTALGAFLQPGDRRPGRGRRTLQQLRRERLRQGIAEREPPVPVRAARVQQREIQTQLLIQPSKVAFVADHQVMSVARLRLNGERFERDFRSDAGDVTQ